MSVLPDSALVVRGGQNLPDNFRRGSDVTIDVEGLLSGVSVQCAGDKTVMHLSRSILNKQIGVTTVGKIRRAGGRITPAPTLTNPDHCLLSGIDAETASRLFTPTLPNPNRVR